MVKTTAENIKLLLFKIIILSLAGVETLATEVRVYDAVNIPMCHRASVSFNKIYNVHDNLCLIKKTRPNSKRILRNQCNKKLLHLVISVFKPDLDPAVSSLFQTNLVPVTSRGYYFTLIGKCLLTKDM